MSDKLNLNYINSLPQPFMAVYHDGYKFPLHDIDVETGLLRIDVCGKLQVGEICDVSYFIDCNGNKHDPDTFYTDYMEQ